MKPKRVKPIRAWGIVEGAVCSLFKWAFILFPLIAIGILHWKRTGRLL